MINKKAAMNLITNLQAELEKFKEVASNKNIEIIKEVDNQKNITIKENEKLCQLVSDCNKFVNDEVSINQFNDLNVETQMLFIQKWKENNVYFTNLSIIFGSNFFKRNRIICIRFLFFFISYFYSFFYNIN